jgi:CRISPR-associated protein Cmr4
MSTTRLLIVHARSPLHAGTGQATAAVDLPIARDRATGFPLLPGSSIKGALRGRARENGKLSQDWTYTFGPETDNASEHAGAVAISDARLLLLPVRSVAGTFAWVTSPYLLAGFTREAALAGFSNLLTVPKVVAAEAALVTTSSALSVEISGKKKVVLEEFDLNAQVGADAVADALAPLVFASTDWQAMLKQRLCIVHDDTMSFLAQHATDIVTRVSINPETGTAKKGQLWTEENLPAESVLVSLVEEQHRHSQDKGGHLDRIAKALLNHPVQLGGKATVGRGRCALHFATKGGK